MGRWLRANGGGYALVFLGLALAGLTSRTAGLIVVGIGAVVVCVEAMPWWRARANREAERSRQQAVLRGLHNEYVLSHDGISPGLLAGSEPLPREWVEARLAQMGERWRRDHYYASEFEPPPSPSGVVVQQIARPGGDRLEVFGTVDGAPYVAHGWESALTNYLPPEQDIRDENDHHRPGYGLTRHATNDETQAYYKSLLREAAGQERSS
jgi:hypothetical protein